MEAALSPVTPELLGKIQDAEARIMEFPQIEVPTEHILHGGMYSRTVRLNPGVVIVGALIKVPTVLIVNGSCAMLAGDKWIPLDGYNVFAAPAGRKQVFATKTLTEITMIFPTEAKSVEEAEAEFTDEAGKLLSHRQAGQETIFITGEQRCLG